MINIILHSLSFHMKFMKLAKARSINFKGNDHSCKIFYILIVDDFQKFVFECMLIIIRLFMRCCEKD